MIRDPFAGYDQWKTASPYDDDEEHEPLSPTVEQQKRLDAVQEKLNAWRPPAPATLEEVLKDLPEGDFRWDDDDPGDPSVYCCGEKDCPIQWHESYTNSTIERKDGKLSIDIHNGDSDGNWDIECGWEEGENWETSGVGWYFGQRHLDEYFHGWTEYWLDCAETGKDPCNQIIRTPDNWVEFCLEVAERNVMLLTEPED